MSLPSGTKLGVYEIVAPLGAGGMGEVYRARDTKLGREVAIKVLPDAVAADAERITRFEREAKALAALNHPHIATLFGVELAEGRHLIVMELVEGDTLAERIGTADRLPLHEVLTIGIQLAEALEAAHERGIVHRDLKPANIKVTGEPLSVKVLDFGLAKAFDPAAGSRYPAAEVTNSPTLSVMATSAGMILGTAAYMSPEQAKGQLIDHRSDIFSFGCVLFEMITGRRAFDGEGASEILASVIKSDPDWSLLPSHLHPRLLELLRQCLEKSRRQRWQAIGDVRLQLEHIRRNPAPPAVDQDAVASAHAIPVWRRVLAGVALAAIGASLATLMFLARKPDQGSQPVTKFILPFREGETITMLTRRQVALSSDGTELAYVADQRLYVRRLGDLESRPITDQGAGLSSPVYSPDGRWIAFYDLLAREVRRVASSGGVTTRVVAIGRSPFDLAWSTEGLFYTADEGIMRVDPERGSSQLVARAEAGETLGSISALPGGALLVSSVRGLESASSTPNAFDRAQVVAIQADGQRRVLLEGGTSARYLTSGHLVFVRQGVIFAVPFDAKGLTIAGASVPVVEGVSRAQTLGQFSASSTGTLVYIPGPAAGSEGRWQPALFGRDLSSDPFRIPPGPYVQAIVSPDGTAVALSTENDKESAIWLYDLTGANTMRRLTLGAPARYPVWSADGKRLTYQQQGDKESGIFWRRADGSDTPEQLTTPAPGTAHVPHSWSADGEHLLFDELADRRVTLWVYSVRDRKTTALPDTQSTAQTGATFSPDGRWIALTLRLPEARSTVFVQPYPTTGSRYQISDAVTEDGHHPVWSRDGRTLSYSPGPYVGLKVKQVRTAPTFSLGAVNDLRVPFRQMAPISPRPYDLLPDGRFVGFAAPGGMMVQAVEHLVVVLNWFEELKQKVK